MPDALTPAQREQIVADARERATKLRSDADDLWRGMKDSPMPELAESLAIIYEANATTIQELLDTLTAEREAHRQELQRKAQEAFDEGVDEAQAMMDADCYAEQAKNNNPYTTPTTTQG